MDCIVESKSISLKAFLRHCSPGDYLTLYEGKIDRWWTHFDGAVIKKDDQFSLNGDSIIYNGPFHGFKEDIGGVIIQINRSFTLHSSPRESKIIYTGSPDDWWRHAAGGIIQKRAGYNGNKFVLNESDNPIYEGRGINRPHPEGVLIESGLIIKLYRPNEKVVIFQGQRHEYKPNFVGITTRFGDKFLKNGDKLICETKWDDWKPHPDGVIIRLGNKLIFYPNPKD